MKNCGIKVHAWAAWAAVLFLALSGGGTAGTPAQASGAGGPRAQLSVGRRAPARIVSVVPAVTEMLFAIGAGSRVAAVSSFDHYPPAVEALPRVGALLDPDIEKILSLKPNLVIVYATQTDLREQLARAGVPAFPYAHGTLPDVTKVLRELGRWIGSAVAADQVAGGIERGLDAIRRRVSGRPRPRTLLVFGREPLALRNVHASGAYGFLHDMLETAGGANVLSDVPRESVQVTTETILARAPEVILELHDSRALTDAQLAREREAWRLLPSVPAVRHGRVHLLMGDEFVIPGPRVVAGIEKLARALHPGAF